MHLQCFTIFLVKFDAAAIFFFQQRMGVTKFCKLYLFVFVLHPSGKSKTKKVFFHSFIFAVTKTKYSQLFLQIKTLLVN
jgi:hypothetical protein